MDTVEFLKENDKVSKWLNIEVIEAKEGYVCTQMVVRKDMLNAANICHGGVIFSLADYTFALASNIYGNVALAISANINFANPAFEGDTLIAYANELNRTKKIGLYSIQIKRKSDDALIALFSGEVFIKSDKILKHQIN